VRGPLAFLLTLILWAAWGAPARAQERPPEPPDTARLSPEAQLRARQLERLQRLARPPGQDTLPGPVDSIATTPGGPGAMPIPDVPERAVAAADSVMEALLKGLPGYRPFTYEGATATFQAGTRDLRLLADSARKVTVIYETAQQPYQLTADTSIHFNQQRDLVEANGRPVYTPPGGEPVASRRLLIDTRTQQASAFGAETAWTENATWKITGDLPRVQRDMVFATHARFTSCTLEVPHFHFGSNRVKVIRGNMLVAAPVTLYFADVPVFIVPFLAQSLSQGRASGLLTPRFSVNDVVRSSGGYERRISNLGFYWAMSDYTDATVALDWFSGNFTALTGSLRYRHLKSQLGGTISARQYWRSTGGTELSLNGNHSWTISERSSMNASVAFVSSGEFVRQTTFDPIEATQQITSSGGLTRRFDWGQLNVLGNRSQSLSDDRVDMTLPRATLSLKPITLFAAPGNRASWFNNMTWSGGMNVSRRTLDFPDQPADAPFLFPRADQWQTQGAWNQSLSIGNLSLSQSAGFQQGVLLGVPRDSLPYFPADSSLRRVDLSQTSLDWSAGVSYQQRLIGATSITPNVTFSSTAVRSDTLELAQSFVSAPTRVSFGANLSSQLYGFFPGFGPFEAMRHRLSPGASYQWAPEVEPTELQRQVFGSRTLQPQSVLTLSLSQTFEAKRRAREPEEGAGAAQAAVLPPTPVLPDSTRPALLSPDSAAGGPRRRPQGEIVTLLSLATSSVTYDFVQADSARDFVQGFTTTRLRNEIGSDFLRGLTLSVEHDLFNDSILSREGERAVIQRRFDPHLSSVNLRFSVNARSGFLRLLGLGPDSADAGAAFDDDAELDDPFAVRRSVTDEASILPGSRSAVPAPRRTAEPGRRRDWSAAVGYALLRPRYAAFQEPSQNLTVSLNAQPTDLWTMSWRTSYDLESRRFSDHMVTLTRDMHEWQAHFDFLKTATGNWAFRFEVTLLDLPDLHFDFDQRSVDAEGRLPPN
jgi:hypothetical protein